MIVAIITEIECKIRFVLKKFYVGLLILSFMMYEIPAVYKKARNSQYKPMTAETLQVRLACPLWV